jgi:ABC-type transporter Mla MlaB component
LRLAPIAKETTLGKEGSNPDLVICDVGELLHVDVAAVDALARLQLTARRLGFQVRLRHASNELTELLGFMGLDEVLPLRGES